jgi:hypothetical protein
MVRALESKLETRVNIGPDSHFMGALGAALFALDKVLALDAARPRPPEKAIAWTDG